MLPIHQHLSQIAQLLEAKGTLVLEAEPGAGKSTAVPLSLLSATWLGGKKIVMLEPRRVAVKSIASFLARQLGEAIGETVGYQIRNESKVSAKTKLEIVTEGVLTRRIQSDPELSDTALLIFDEFHERSIHADLAMMLSQEIRLGFRDDLRILVMSASMDSEFVSEYLDRAPILACEGRVFPVETVYQASDNQPIAQQVSKALNYAMSAMPKGDALVFLPGQGDINRVYNLLKEQFVDEVELLTLFGAMPLNEQMHILNGGKGGLRRIILSTNIAETSLTIPNITIVIDSGLEKRINFDVKSGLSRLDTQRIALSSAVQRAGRAGRTQAGLCIRLWSSQEHTTFADFPKEEIMTTDLDGVVLELAKWGIARFNEANWLSAPPLLHFESAQTLNRQLGFLSDANKLTELGLKAHAIPAGPRLSAIKLAACNESERQVASILLAVLQERDILLAPHSAQLLDRILVVLEGLQRQAIFGVRKNLVQQILQSIKSKSDAKPVESTYSPTELSELIARLLLVGFPDRIAKQSPSDRARYTLANGRGVRLKADDPLCKHDWLIVVDCDGQNKDGLIYLAEPVSEPVLLEKLQSHLVAEERWQLDATKEKLLGRRELRFQQLTVKSENLPAPSPKTFKTCVASLLNEEGLSLLNWNEQCVRWVARTNWLSQYLSDFPEINELTLVNSAAEWLLPYLPDVTNLRALKQVPIFGLLKSTLTWEQQQVLDQEAPDNYETPSGTKVRIDYCNAAPTVAVRLQEVFGEVESLRIAGGRVALRYELLSPALRPLQTTSDLAHFWRNAYVEVAKEMRGRYPKHRWPEEPWLEKAGHSLKSRQPK
ncbi:ATP-dependent helicase HrpB [Pseudoalteromonas xiamenensis]